MKIEEKLSEPWILFTDGSSCADGSSVGLILTSPEGMEFTYALRFEFEATNNKAEYEALIAGLRIAEQMGIKSLQANIPRSKNKKADALSKITSTSFAHLSKQVLVEELKEKSINRAEILVIVEEEGETWMTPIHDYITRGILPAEVDMARAVKRKSQRMYAGSRSVVSKALQIGYYWPTMHKDARALIGTRAKVIENQVMAASTIPVSAEENLGDPIDIRVDVIHPEPVTAVAFPEELMALRFRADIAETENASLRTRIKTTEAIEKITHNRERQARVKIEQPFGSG
ncbi:reverse transcriptase domain-containing protein [Tanacetum coccineum]|uniref:Reverse transcriptase domain-containing protein n=1 Tax=Tanacetum coccineum TaxID=301880 RepID=A0ABQ4XUR8_9ASTR